MSIGEQQVQPIDLCRAGPGEQLTAADFLACAAAICGALAAFWWMWKKLVK